jgi:hypothetical protein
MKEKSAKGLGKEGMNDAQLTKALEMNALNPV